MKINTKSILGLAAVLSLAIATVAFANGGWGYDSHMDGYDGHMMEPGHGGGHMMNYDCNYGRYGHGHDAWNNLSDADAAELDASQEKFYADTFELHSQINEKELALRNEMNQSNPDQNRAITLQKELSSPQSDFDQKALAHQLEVRKLLPKDYRGSGYGYGPAYCR